ncbi:hypothetical protein CBS101457_005255 [Exobasidium rhododendri]|nr:hypothetical protein CBS101457_005255 [Exobasidium rhododendri]
MTHPPIVRRARHAGSWYEDDEKLLDKQLQGWLNEVRSSQIPTLPSSVIQVGLPGWSPSGEALSLPIDSCKAIIAPHAGYSYSGAAAAYAYKCIDPSLYNRIFILGPSHKIYLSGCALSSCDIYETPVGDLPVDKETIKKLKATKQFLREDMSRSIDENEHSIEMHLPYIRKVFEGKRISIVPILVGATSPAQEASMGKVLASYLADKKTLFVVSSDFCHWGSRFDYTYYKPDSTTKMRSLTSRDIITSSKTPIHASIRALDADSAQSQSSSTSPPRKAKKAQAEFNQYLKETKNTICGRHPIGVLMGALAALEEDEGHEMQLRFTRYEQSSECISVSDSSVSYGSAFVSYV